MSKNSACEDEKVASYGNRTRASTLEGLHANHCTNDAMESIACPRRFMFEMKWWNDLCSWGTRQGGAKGAQMTD